jgi:hypothetical protein
MKEPTQNSLPWDQLVAEHEEILAERGYAGAVLLELRRARDRFRRLFERKRKVNKAVAL